MRDSTTSRRTALKSILGVAGTLVPVVHTTSATGTQRIPDEDKVDRRLESKYGSQAASRAMRVIKEYYQRYESGYITFSTFHTEVTKELKEYEATKPIAKDVLRTNQEIQQRRKQYDKLQVENDPVDPSKESLVESSETLFLTRSSSDGSTSGVGQNNYTVDYDGSFPRYLRARSRSYIYGSAWASARASASYNPTSSGSHTVDISYYREGVNRSGEATIYIFISENGSENKESAETLVGAVSGEESRFETFALEEGTEYEIGMEIYTVAQASADGSVANFYTIDATPHRVDTFSSINITKI